MVYDITLEVMEVASGSTKYRKMSAVGTELIQYGGIELNLMLKAVMFD
jgi:hypothetical protein